MAEQFDYILNIGADADAIVEEVEKKIKEAKASVKGQVLTISNVKIDDNGIFSNFLKELQKLVKSNAIDLDIDFSNFIKYQNEIDNIQASINSLDKKQIKNIVSSDLQKEIKITLKQIKDLEAEITNLYENKISAITRNRKTKNEFGKEYAEYKYFFDIFKKDVENLQNIFNTKKIIDLDATELSEVYRQLEEIIKIRAKLTPVNLKLVDGTRLFDLSTDGLNIKKLTSEIEQAMESLRRNLTDKISSMQKEQYTPIFEPLLQSLKKIGQTTKNISDTSTEIIDTENVKTTSKEIDALLDKLEELENKKKEQEDSILRIKDTEHPEERAEDINQAEREIADINKKIADVNNTIQAYKNLNLDGEVGSSVLSVKELNENLEKESESLKEVQTELKKYGTVFNNLSFDEVIAKMQQLNAQFEELKAAGKAKLGNSEFAALKKEIGSLYKYAQTQNMDLSSLGTFATFAKQHAANIKIDEQKIEKLKNQEKWHQKIISRIQEEIALKQKNDNTTVSIDNAQINTEDLSAFSRKDSVPNLSYELEEFEKLKLKIQEVVTAINEKTEAIKKEETQVNESVKVEIESLEKLIQKVREIGQTFSDNKNGIHELFQLLNAIPTSLDLINQTGFEIKGINSIKEDLIGIQDILSNMSIKSLNERLSSEGFTFETASATAKWAQQQLAIDDKTGIYTETDNLIETVTAYHDRIKDTNAYLQKGNDLIEERAILIKNGLQVGNEYIMSDPTGKVNIGNGIKKTNADSVLHTHAYNEEVNNLRFSDADIQGLVDGTVKKALLLCGNEIATLDMTNVEASQFEDLKNDILGAYKAVFARFGAEIKEGKLVGIDTLSPEIQNQATDIVNNLVRNIMQNYGGDLLFDKIVDNDFIENDAIRLPQIESSEMAIIQKYLDAVASDKPVENIITLQKQFGVLKTNIQDIQDTAKSTNASLSFIEESSGQLAMFEGVEEQQKELKQAAEQTNEVIEGQIDLLQYLSSLDDKSDVKKKVTNPSEKGFEPPKGWITDVDEAWDNATSEQIQRTADAYDNLTKKIEKYYKLKLRSINEDLNKNDPVKFKELTNLESEITAAISGVGKYSNATKEAKKSQDKFNSELAETEKIFNSKIFNSYDKQINLLTANKGNRINGYDTELETLLQEFEKLKSLLPLKFTNEQDIANFKRVQDNVDTLISNLQDNKYIPATSTEYDTLSAKYTKYYNKNSAAPANLRNQLKGLLEDFEKIYKSAEGLNKIQLEEFRAEFKKLENQIEKTGKTGLSMSDKISKKLKDLFAYAMTYVSIQDAIQVGREGLEIIKEYDTGLTEMKKVSDETLQTLKEFREESFSIADAVGTTASQIQNSTADWMRLGESLEDAKQSAQDANILFNVSEFESINEATESLVSMSQAFKELEKGEIVDVVNNLGNNFAISTDGLAIALKDSASSLQTAKNDFFESAALVTAANTVVQDPSKVGAGLRTIALRLTGTEAAREELAALGEDVDDFIVTTTSTMDQKIKDLTKTQGNFGVSLLDMNGNYRSTYDILLDIAKVWDEIAQEDLQTGENRQNALLEMMAGKNRSNILASVLQSPEVLEEAYAYALDSEGSALKENEAYLESIEGHLTKLKNQWDNLWVSENNREVINFFIDLGISILEVVNNFGALNTLLIGGGGIFAATKFFKNNGRFKMSSLIFI